MELQKSLLSLFIHVCLLALILFGGMSTFNDFINAKSSVINMIAVFYGFFLIIAVLVISISFGDACMKFLDVWKKARNK